MAEYTRAPRWITLRNPAACATCKKTMHKNQAAWFTPQGRKMECKKCHQKFGGGVGLATHLRKSGHGDYAEYKQAA